MRRRKTLKLLGTAGVATSLSGCSSILGGGCGLGEDEIGSIAADLETTAAGTSDPSAGTDESSSVDVVGEIQSIGDNEVIIDDGTGVAKLTTLFGGFETQNVGSGDCAEAAGIPLPPEDGSDNDIQILIEEIGLANE